MPSLLAKANRQLSNDSTCEEAEAARSVAVVAEDSIGERLIIAREAQKRWERRSIRERVRFLREFRRRIVDHAAELAQSTLVRCRSTRAEKVVAEVVPLVEACEYLERSAAKVLAPRRLGTRGRPIWLMGVTSVVERVPLGVVLIVAPSNYPLMLAGIQALQAIVAGDAVIWKPGEGGTESALLFAEIARSAGLDPNLLIVTDETVDSARRAIEVGVDKVIFTGSANSGRAILASLAPRLTPATLELSGCDACFILPDADLELVSKSLAFGLRFNGSETCIAPRRVFTPRSRADELESKLKRAIVDVPNYTYEGINKINAIRMLDDAISGGARVVAGAFRQGDNTDISPLIETPLILADVDPRCELMRSDLFMPWMTIVRYDSVREAIEADSACPYALGASIFGDENEARELARELRAGSIVINDLITPTADPRLPFGGFGSSGFGSTRGPEGLLDLTAARVVSTSRARFKPHLDPVSEVDEALITSYLHLKHGHKSGFFRSLRSLLRAARERRNESTRIGS